MRGFIFGESFRKASSCLRAQLSGNIPMTFRLGDASFYALEGRRQEKQAQEVLTRPQELHPLSSPPRDFIRTHPASLNVSTTKLLNMRGVAVWSHTPLRAIVSYTSNILNLISASILASYFEEGSQHLFGVCGG